MMRHRMLVLGLALLAGACGEDPLTPGNPAVSRVAITPAHDVTLEVAGQVQLTAGAFAPDGSPILGRTVTWSTDRAAVATVTAGGMVTGLSDGTANITAEIDGVMAGKVVTVRPGDPVVSRVAITPDGDIALPVAGQVQLTAGAFALDGSPILGRAVTWSTDRAAVATVTADGRVTALSDGTATITARIGGVTADKVVTVRRDPPPAVATVVVEPAELVLEPGARHQLAVRLLAADGTSLTGRPVTWQSSDEGRAVVSASGEVEARQGGLVWITATSEGKAGRARVTIPSWSGAPLLRVAGAPLPVVWWTGRVTDDNGVEVTRTIRLVAGSLRVNLGEQRYEQAFTMERWEDAYVMVNGVPVVWGVALKETRVFDDNGTVAPLFDGAATLGFRSTARLGQQFTGVQTERGFDVTQRINGSGDLLFLRFAR
jgi:hypothetical protein